MNRLIGLYIQSGDHAYLHSWHYFLFGLSSSCACPLVVASWMASTRFFVAIISVWASLTTFLTWLCTSLLILSGHHCKIGALQCVPHSILSSDSILVGFVTIWKEHCGMFMKKKLTVIILIFPIETGFEISLWKANHILNFQNRKVSKFVPVLKSRCSEFYKNMKNSHK